MNITIRGTNLPVGENSEILLRNPQKLPRDDVLSLMGYGRIFNPNAPLDELPLLEVGVLALPQEVTITGLVDKPSKIFGVVHTRQPGRKQLDCVRTQTRSDVWTHPASNIYVAGDFVKLVAANMSEKSRAAKPERYNELAILEEYPDESLLKLSGLVLNTCVQLLQ